MSQQKIKYDKEIAGYVPKILIEISDSDNTHIEDLQFPECKEDLRDENLEEKNPSSDSEINAWDHEITENNSDERCYSKKDSHKMRKKS